MKYFLSILIFLFCTVHCNAIFKKQNVILTSLEIIISNQKNVCTPNAAIQLIDEPIKKKQDALGAYGLMAFFVGIALSFFSLPILAILAFVVGLVLCFTSIASINLKLKTGLGFTIVGLLFNSIAVFANIVRYLNNK